MSGRARGFFGTILTIASAFTPLGWAAALAIAGSVLSYSGQKKLQREAERRARASRDREAVTINARGGYEPLLMVFGKARVGGLVCVLGTENGPDMANQYVYMGLAHSVAHAGGCEGIEDIWIDDTRIDSTSINGSGDVTVGDFNGLLRVTHYRGTGTQAADATLTAAGLDYSTAYRRGVAWTLFRMKRPLDSEAFRKAFKYGFPNASVELKGIRVYDPRLDSTNGGSGAHRYNDSTTWEWVNAGNEIGRNPILCAATYSIMRRLDGGEGMPPERIIWSSVAAAASKCDEATSWGKRFRCDGVLPSQDDPGVNLQRILDSCAGKRIEVGGQYAFHAASWATETVTIDSTWLAGGFELQVLSPLESGWNAVRINYNGGTDYKTIEAPPYTNSAYETDDGGQQQFTDMTLPMVVVANQAQYLSQIHGKRSRMQKVLALKCNARAFDVQLWETAQVNLTVSGQDLSSLRWRIAHWVPNGNNFDLVLEQDVSTVYDVEAFTTPVAGDPPVVGAETGPAPTGLTATAVSDGIVLRWTLPPEYLFTRIRIERSPDGVGSWALVGTEAATATSSIDPVLDGATYFYRINGHNRTGTPSLYSSTVSATAKQGADAGSVKVSNAGFEFGDSGWDKDSGAWSIVKDGSQRTGSWCAKLPGTGASISKKLRNTKQAPCAPGELVSVAGFLKSTASATGTGAIEVSFLDSAGAELSATAGNAITPGVTYRRSKIQATAPASTAYVRVQFAVSSFNSAASEAWYADDSSLEMFIDTLDHLPDGGVYGRPKQTALTSGEVDLAKAGVIGRSADNISEAATRKWAAESGAQVFTGKSITGLIDRTLANIADTTTRFAAPVPNATSDATFLTTGTMTLGGNAAEKASGTGWDAQVYSKDAYRGGAAAQATPEQANKYLMFGLNTDPTLDASYTSIDYAMYMVNDGSLEAYESGVGAGVIGAYAAGDVLAVTYDGSFVRYLKNGTALRTVAASPNLVFFFDSSFHDTGAKLSHMRFIPLTSNDMDNVGEGTTYKRIKATALTSGEVDLTKAGVLNKSADNIAESGSRKWAGESGADVTAGKSVNVLADVKTVAQFFTFTQTIVATGASSITIPTGAKLLVIRAWGGGGGGARVSLSSSNRGAGGGGGGSKKTVVIQPSDHGGSISYSVGTGGAGKSTNANGDAGTATTVTSSGLSFTNLNISANGGGGGTNAAGGAAGTASGGDTNTSGSAGTFSTISLGGQSAVIDSVYGPGGDEQTSFYPFTRTGQQPGGGGAGHFSPNTSGSGGAGMVSFTWSG